MYSSNTVASCLQTPFHAHTIITSKVKSLGTRLVIPHIAAFHGLYTDVINLLSSSMICTDAVELSTMIVKFCGSSNGMLSSTMTSVKFVQPIVLGGTTVIVVIGLKTGSEILEREHSCANT